MEGTSSSSFPANYVSLKDLQARWLKRKQDEENEEKHRKLHEQEKNKLIKNKEAEKQETKSKKPPNRYSRKPTSPPSAATSRSQAREWKDKNLLNVLNSKESEEIGADSQTSRGITGRRNGLRLASARSRMLPSESESVIEIADKREKKDGKGMEIAGRDCTAEICRRMASLAKESKEISFNAKESEAIGANSETSPCITCRRKTWRGGSARSRMLPSEPKSVVEIEKKGMESPGEDHMEVIGRRMASIAVSSGSKGRSRRISRGGDYGLRQSGGRERVWQSAAGMVWVRKTREA